MRAVSAEWSLRAYKAAGGDESVRFQTDLVWNGKKAAVVSNSGEGGPNQYVWLDNGARVAFDSMVQRLYGDLDKYHDRDDEAISDMAEAATQARRAVRMAKQGFPITRIVEAESEVNWMRDAGEHEESFVSFRDTLQEQAYLADHKHLRSSRLDARGYPTVWEV